LVKPITRSAEVKRDAFVSGVVACAILAGSCVAGAALAAMTSLQGDPTRGRTLYQGCTGCHSVDDNDLGPRHRGVVGRRAGSIQDYSYSPALKNSGLTWDEATLDRWLTNPSALVPGTKMFFKLDAAQDRADVISYLESLK
jgi:cytochrome c